MDLPRLLAVLAEPPSSETPALAALPGLEPAPSPAAHTTTFLFGAYPYASVYLGEAGMIGGEAGDFVAGFFRVLDAPVPAEPDHVSVLLGAYASLSDHEVSTSDPRARAMWRRARLTLLHEHLQPWLPVFCATVRRAGAPPYDRWAELLDGWLHRECRVVGVPDAMPRALVDPPALGDPRESPATFLSELLAPIRTGFVVTHRDLADAAHELGLGMRAGERRYALQSLVDQEPVATLEWLAGLATRAAAHWDGHMQGLEPVGAFWSERARRSARLLTEVAADARGGLAWSQPSPVTPGPPPR